MVRAISSARLMSASAEFPSGGRRALIVWSLPTVMTRPLRPTRRASAYLAAAAIATGSSAAFADSAAPVLPTAPRPHAYAVVVGSNAGGAGQGPLRFAEGDAQRVAAVLREIGHFDGG